MQQAPSTGPFALESSSILQHWTCFSIRANRFIARSSRSRVAFTESKTTSTSTRLAAIAERFIEACRSAGGGHGVDLVALTDHNSIEGYKRLLPLFQSISHRAQEEGSTMPVVLPGVEFSVGGERPIHFLSIFASETDPAKIEGLIHHVFQERDKLDRTTGTPRATGESIGTFLERLYKYARPATGERNLQFVLLPTHADGARGVAKESGIYGSGAAASLWEFNNDVFVLKVQQLGDDEITRNWIAGIQPSLPPLHSPQDITSWRPRAARAGSEWISVWCWRLPFDSAANVARRCVTIIHETQPLLATN